MSASTREELIDKLRMASDLTYKGEMCRQAAAQIVEDAKKDAALDACIEAKNEVKLIAAVLRGYEPSIARSDALRATRVLDAAIAQAKEARG